MGFNLSKSQHIYGVFRDDIAQVPGYSRELICIANKDNPGQVKGPEYKGMKTIYDLTQYALRKYPNNKFLGTRNSQIDGKPYEWLTYREVLEEKDTLARGIKALNLCQTISYEGQDWQFMGINSKNRKEWTITALACMRSSITIVPFFENLNLDGLAYIINQTGLQTMSLEKNTFDKVMTLVLEKKIHSLKNILTFEQISEEQLEQAKTLGINVFSYLDVLNAGLRNPRIQLQEPKQDTIYMFCYTSGTTGEPKAAMLPHSAFVSNQHLHDYGADSKQLQEDDVHISYLPYAHTYEQLILIRSFVCGMSIGFYSGDLNLLFQDLKVLKPTMMAVVPRILTKIYQMTYHQVNSKGGLAKSLFDRAVEVKVENLIQRGIITHKLWDKLIFSKIKEIFGGNLRQIFTGAAAIDPKVYNFFRVALSMNIQEGYGQTEGCGGGTITKTYDLTGGHVGGVVPMCRLRLRDITEMGYLSRDNPPRGEIQITGTCLFKGYYKNPEKTKEVLTEDGWLNTGDVGLIMPNGSVKIIDRASYIFKLSQGEYIAPEKLQNIYLQQPIIHQIFVYGDSLRDYLVAIIVPDMPLVKLWAATAGIEITSDDILIQNPLLKEHLVKLLNEKANEFSLNGLERIKKVHLTSNAFSPENDLVTPTMKIKRFNVKQHFQKEIEELYQS
ncbi:long-chain-fatty-acid--ligase 5 [Stylonychia lemnae]|uniref:Long-chain-fatty-acid--ligase 5 n=1 Tax=Stylonychia lemnae TaxID=5949 RepID=A0A078B6H8_STYLE|nr:long-chain-fatty-acid--ligase 5 [Stylonychia lemnae]|eukprot:CDW90135.1 long-chain-fatty-acid--ligase 5 [Stylonychia lemnae]